VLFFTISVWNIVGSIFVEKVMDTAKPHPHEVLQQMKIQDKVDAAEMKQFFAEFDRDGDGSLDEHEWMRVVKSGKLLDFMALRDVDLKDESDIKMFFALARECCSDTTNPTNMRFDVVPVDALISMFLKVKGPASALDVAIMTQGIAERQKTILQSLANVYPEVFDQGGLQTVSLGKSGAAWNI
jgi:hypothetical protein